VKNTPTVVNTPVPDISKEKIVFATASGLRIINDDGTNLQSLTDVEGDNFPVCSPDGKKIVFINYREGRNLYVINSDGKGRKKITENLSVLPYIEWLKNGKTMFFGVEFSENLYYTT
jgi:Tol biopolymer transport system component